jgi:hypothetical protein
MPAGSLSFAFGSQVSVSHLGPGPDVLILPAVRP